MKDDSILGKTALITGGTSGLGRSIAIYLKERGCEVYVVGTNGKRAEQEGLNFLFSDFTNFQSVISLVDEIISKKLTFNILINNAGILSPPSLIETVDGFEKSYQVNFLAHVLLTRLLNDKGLLRTPVVINTSSPIYKRGVLNDSDSTGQYNLIKAYANSKLYLALFSEQLALEGIRGFAFNPGTFSSGIYRTQENWFHFLYKVAAPFMISADMVAKKVVKILEGEKYSNGMIISKSGSEKSITKYGDDLKKEFWLKINNQLDRYF